MHSPYFDEVPLAAMSISIIVNISLGVAIMVSTISTLITSWEQARGDTRWRTKAFTPFFAALLLSPAATAVTCINSNSANNPDAIYTVHGDGTATDTRTGLMWKVCSEGRTWSAGDCAGTDALKTWTSAMADAESHVFADYSDWRLPNLKELHTLVEFCAWGPSINTSVFPSEPGGSFWSGSPYVGGSSQAWYVIFGWGESRHGTRSSALSVRLVRGGQ